MQPNTPKFKEWIAAERQAQDADRALWAVARGFGGEDAAPIGELAEAARRNRERARALCVEAMEEMKQLAEALHYRKVLQRETPLRSMGGGESQRPARSELPAVRDASRDA